jgi:hypothetical protein
MVVAITDDRWAAVRTSVRATADRFADLLSSAGETRAPAIGTWSVAETAAHVATVAWLYTFMVAPQHPPFPIPGLADRIRNTTTANLAELNEVTLAHLTERSLPALGVRLRADVDHILRASDGLDPRQRIAWLGDARLSVASVLAHLLNELLIHGRDIARATRARWVYPPQDAAMALELFLFGLLNGDAGRLISRNERVRHRDVTVEVRSRHTTPVLLVLNDGRLSVEPTGRAVDAHVLLDPAAFMLMLFGRVGRTRTALCAKMLVWGRRPWLLPALLGTVRMP